MVVFIWCVVSWLGLRDTYLRNHHFNLAVIIKTGSLRCRIYGLLALRNDRLYRCRLRLDLLILRDLCRQFVVQAV